MHGEAAVGERLAALRERYGDDLPVETRDRTVPPETFEVGREDVRAGEEADARAWVERDGAVLLVRDRSAPDVWTEPGGTVEPDETSWETARRETAEETGVDCRPTEVRAAIRHVLRDEADPDRAVVILQVFFRADYEGGEIAEQDGEIVQARWFEAVPGDLVSAAGVAEGFGQ